MGISEISMRSELEVKPVLEIFPMDSTEAPPSPTTAQKQFLSQHQQDIVHSSSFEALYDLTQLEAVHSNIPPLEDLDIGRDPFRGTFTSGQEAMRSSFENLYVDTTTEVASSEPVISSPARGHYQAWTEMSATAEVTSEQQSSVGSSEQYEDPHWYRIKSPRTDNQSSPGPTEMNRQSSQMASRNQDPESRIQTIQHAHSSSYDETSEGGEAGETSSQTSSAKVAAEAGVQRKASTASSSSKASSVASSSGAPQPAAPEPTARTHRRSSSSASSSDGSHHGAAAAKPAKSTSDTDESPIKEEQDGLLKRRGSSSSSDSD